MPTATRRSSVGGWLNLRQWAVWDLPAWLSRYIIAVVAVYGASIAFVGSATQFHRHDLEVFILLMACNAASVEMTRRTGEPTGLVKDVYVVWEFPVAILLPPLYGLLVPIPRLLLTQLRIRHALAYRRIFSAGAVGLGYLGASVVFRDLAPALGGVSPGIGMRAFLWVGVLAIAGTARWVINMGILVVALKGAEPTTPMRELLWGPELLYNDVAELCIAALVTFAVASSAFLAAFALPFVTLLQRSQRHAQLVDASRIDAKTGLLNAATWQREAAAEVTRAIRTHTPLAVAIADLDHFKAVNDTYGHLAGDAALAAVARAMSALLRDYDITGRFGGEEFVILLPQTSGAEAIRIAERLREKLSEIIIPINSGTAAESPLQVTVSIGVATLDGSRRDLQDMLAAADAALYEAKNTGRNRVCMLADGSPGA